MADPIIKWAGGKRKLVDRIEAVIRGSRSLPGTTLVEPFFGGGAYTLVQGHNYKNILLSEKNDRLRNVYLQIIYAPQEVAEELEWITKQHAPDYRDAYYGIRRVFNESRSETLTPLHAAMFIWLNKTCFNGLYRENKKGEFNVPVGRYKNPSFPTREDIQSVHDVLWERTRCGEYVYSGVEELDYILLIDKHVDIYCDPPYLPFSETADFTAYTADGFSYEDHVALNERAARWAAAGARVVISGYAEGPTREAYKDGTIVDTFEVQRTISRGERRKVLEGLYLYSPETVH